MLKLTAGGGGTPAHADNLLIAMTQLSGDATFTNINIGQDASTLSTKAQVGGFGQGADKVVIKNLSQTAWATTAGTSRCRALTWASVTRAASSRHSGSRGSRSRGPFRVAMRVCAPTARTRGIGKSSNRKEHR